MKKIVVVLVLYCLFFFKNTGNELFSQNNFVQFISADTIKTPFLLLKGWRYKAGDSIEWRETNYNDNHWKQLPELYQFSIYPFKDLKITTNSIWFRNKVYVDSSLAAKPYIVLFASNHPFDLYCDGKFVKSVNRSHEKDKATAIRHNIPVYFFDKAGYHEFAFHYIAKIDTSSIAFDIGKRLSVSFSFALSGKEYYETHSLEHSKTIVSIYNIAIGFFFALGFIHLFLFFYYRKNKSNLYFSLYQFSLMGLFLTFFMNSSYQLRISNSVFSLINDILATFITVFLLQFLYSLFLDKRPKVFKFIVMACVLEIAVDYYNENFGFLAFVIMVLFAGVELFRVMYISISKKKQGSWIIGIGVFITLMFPVWVMIFNMMEISNPYLKKSTIDSYELLTTGNLIICVCSIAPVSISMSIFLACQFSNSLTSLENQLYENKKLSIINLHQEKEKQQILENQNSILEQKVSERTRELVQQKEIVEEKNKELVIIMDNLKSTQQELIKSEKMAAFGAVATRMAHEIQNPLNFVNNFSELSNELIIQITNTQASAEEKLEAITLLKDNLQKINHHGKRASEIIHQLQEHTRKGTTDKFFEE